jgi:hypothetical protein
LGFKSQIDRLQMVVRERTLPTADVEDRQDELATASHPPRRAGLNPEP